MDAFAFEPRGLSAQSPPRGGGAARAAQSRAEPPERDLLYALLEPCLGGIEAAEAMEALVARYGTLAEATAASPRELTAMPAVGEAGAAVLRAVHLAAERLDRRRRARRPVLAQPAGWLAHLRRRATPPAAGEIRALFLDRRGGLLAEESLGGPAGVAPGQAIRRAMALEAAGLVLARHCPEAAPVASEGDLAMARGLALAAAVMGVELRDVVLLGLTGHASLREAGVV